MKGNYTNIYRGIVISNGKYRDSQRQYLKGRIKIFVPGVYSDQYKDKPDLLPWAQPAMSIFGGSWTNQNKSQLNEQTGWCSTPHTGKIAQQRRTSICIF